MPDLIDRRALALQSALRAGASLRTLLSQALLTLHAGSPLLRVVSEEHEGTAATHLALTGVPPTPTTFTGRTLHDTAAAIAAGTRARIRSEREPLLLVYGNQQSAPYALVYLAAILGGSDALFLPQV